MTWIQTYTGRRFYPLAPRAEDIHLPDIAHSLSMLCRFNGHCRSFYSVAEHSVRVADVLPAGLALWGLLHDAAEAYLSDLPRPIKLELPLFSEAEDRLLEIIVRQHGLPWPMPPEVDRADNQLLMTEARDLMEKPPASWKLDIPPLNEEIHPWAPAEAEARFLRRYEALSVSS